MAERILRLLDIAPGLAARTGGVPAAVVQKDLAIAHCGIDPTIFTVDSAYPANAGSFRRATAADFPVGAEQLAITMFPTRPPYRFFYSPALQRALARHVREFDVVGIHSMNLFPQLAAYRRATRDAIPYVVSPHGALHPLPRSRRRYRKAIVDKLWQRDLLNSAAALHVQTAREAELLSTLAPRPECHVIPNGIFMDHFVRPETTRSFREEQLQGYDGPLVMYSGRVSFSKGVDVLIRAIEAVARRAPDLHVAIVGPDDEGAVPMMRTLAQQLGVSRLVTFTGPLFGDAYVSALCEADIWTLPSHSENFGLAAVEAMAAGLPVVLSNQVDLSQEVEQAHAAHLCAPTVEDFAEAITHLLRDRAARDELRLAARAFARQFDWAALAPRYADMYRQVV